MKDLLTEQLHNRLGGHEMDVPPGVWEHVSGQLAAAASGEALRHTMQEKFRTHEVQVDPSAWANISGQLGHGAMASSSFGTGWVAAAAAAVLITAGALYWNLKPGPTAAPETSTPTVAVVPAPAVQPTVPETPSASTQEVEVKLVSSPAEQPATLKQKVTRSVQQPMVATERKPATVTVPPTTANTQPAPAQAPAGQPSVQAGSLPKALPDPGNRVPSAGVSQQATTSQETAPATPTAKPAETHSQPAASPTANESMGNTAGSNPFATPEEDGILIPTAFTPNGDAYNETFAVVLREYAKVDVRVFSAKTGTLVFQTNDLGRVWDGRLPNGNFAEEGNYQCVVNWADHEGHPHSKNVTVRLFR
jgi:gliding motility-associated-like protein